MTPPSEDDRSNRFGERSGAEVRAAGPADVDTVVALVNGAYRGDSSRRGWTTEADLLGGQRVDAAMVAEAMDGARGQVLVLDREGQPVACCELQHRAGSDRAHLGMFAVRPDLQAAGLGRRVLAAAEDEARIRGARRLLLSVIEARGELIAWYERRGYVRTGEVEDFPYGDERFGRPTRADLRFVVLAKDLAEEPGGGSARQAEGDQLRG